MERIFHSKEYLETRAEFDKCKGYPTCPQEEPQYSLKNDVNKVPQQYNMPCITELNLSKENKEMIPLSLLEKDLSNIVDHFDQKFKDYQDYINYLQTNFSN
jgi:hypothetical protein